MNPARLRFSLSLTAIAALVLLAACSKAGSTDHLVSPLGGTGQTPTVSGNPEPIDTSGRVTATEKDFAISLSASRVAAGQTTIITGNLGPSTHELVLLKTNLAPGNLPLDAYGNVDEQAASVQEIGRVEDVTPGSSKEFSADLVPGNYVVICNLPGLYKAGMYAGFTVS